MPMRAGSKQRPGGAKRIAEYMQAHPDEWLSIEDMAKKFDLLPSTVKQCIYDLRAEGFPVTSTRVYHYGKDTPE